MVSSRFNALKAAILISVLLAFCGQASALQPADEEAPCFSIVVLPDTQIYAWKYPEIFHAQTRWIAENVQELNIRFVLHVGDVVEHNKAKEWRIAREAFSLLDGKVPYAIALGNHDMGRRGSARSRKSQFSKYFPVDLFRGWESFGGVYDREPDQTDNSYHAFAAGGRKWLVVALEFGPRDDVLRWANNVVSQHPDHTVIVITHTYLDNDGRRYSRELEKQTYPPYKYPLAKGKGSLNDGEEIWQKLVSAHGNMKLVVSGHVCVAAYLSSTGKAGNVVHQMLVNYQNQKRGGTGWLRLLKFSENAERVHVQDYSPVLDQWSEHPDRNFVLTF
jgi:3',5'-cyclic AMP phosphodiesterase CpdA